MKNKIKKIKYIKESIPNLVTVIGLMAQEDHSLMQDGWFSKQFYKEACDYVRSYIRDKGIRKV